MEPELVYDSHEQCVAVSEQIKLVVDPELLFDIWTLELIKKLHLQNGTATVTMTLTTPFCPYGPQIIDEVKERVCSVEGISSCEVKLTFEEPWTPSDDLKMMLGLPL